MTIEVETMQAVYEDYMHRGDAWEPEYYGITQEQIDYSIRVGRAVFNWFRNYGNIGAVAYYNNVSCDDVARYIRSEMAYHDYRFDPFSCELVGDESSITIHIDQIQDLAGCAA